MLQQTQVKTVLERYYQPFLRRFPTIAALAEAPRDALMKAWEGLGYYSRANNLQRAAQLCVEQHNGLLPQEYEPLLALPGIGKNTAHAVMAFAFHKPVAVMEANLKRVLCRIFALPSPSENELFTLAQAMVDRSRPFDYNQAMMDIGAMVCTKRAPDCSGCPASTVCEGQNAPELYPAPKVKQQTPVRERVIIVWKNVRGQYHLKQRDTKFLHGLYGFDEYTSISLLPSFQKLGNVTQTYSHFQLRADVYLTPMDSRLSGSDNQFYGLKEIHSLPLSRADAKILKLLEDHEARFASTARRKK